MWWQVITSAFMHTGLDHLAETTFFIYIFGRLLERTAGWWGIWLAYISAAVGECAHRK